MSSRDEIQAAIEAHRRAVAAVEAAQDAREQAVNRLCDHRPSCLDGALDFFGYLATLQDELTSIAEMSAVCYGNALKAKERVAAQIGRAHV